MRRLKSLMLRPPAQAWLRPGAARNTHHANHARQRWHSYVGASTTAASQPASAAATPEPSWLPALLYTATYSAKLQQSGGAPSVWPGPAQLTRHGLPVLHPCELQPDCSSQSRLSSGECYLIDLWECQWSGPLCGAWSEHYASQRRTPELVELAPWVAARWAPRKRGRHKRTTTSASDDKTD